MCRSRGESAGFGALIPCRRKNGDAGGLRSGSGGGSWVRVYVCGSPNASADFGALIPCSKRAITGLFYRERFFIGLLDRAL
jgi:hypothetical protein